MRIRQVLSISLALLAACRTEMTSFKPLADCDDGYSCFEYTAHSGIDCPPNSNSAEKTRIKMLETWLSLNGHPDADYEIVSRQPVLARKALLGNVYEIFYTVKVKTQ